MKRIKPQPELSWTEPEAFALVPEQGIDWAERAEAQAKRDHDKKESEQKQEQLFN